MDQVGDLTNCGFGRICVFCGSSSGKKSIYTEVAQQLGNELVRRDIDLVYGGGSIGLMGKVAHAVHDAGGHVVGVIPKALMPKEVCGSTVGDLVAVDDMHQRKAEMARRADAFIALPGGFGTLEEVLEIITWAQLGIHKKPVGLLNVDGYYDAMLSLFDKALDEGFLNLASHNIVVSAPTAAELLDKLKSYTPTVDKTTPELTWETTTGTTVSAISPGESTAAEAIHSHSYSSSRGGARAFGKYTPRRTSMGVADDQKLYYRDVNGIRGSGLLRHFQPPRDRRFFVRSCPIYEICSGSTAAASQVCAPAASAARVVFI